jgi:hypothetical protein
MAHSCAAFLRLRIRPSPILLPQYVWARRGCGGCARAARTRRHMHGHRRQMRRRQRPSRAQQETSAHLGVSRPQQLDVRSFDEGRTRHLTPKKLSITETGFLPSRKLEADEVGAPAVCESPLGDQELGRGATWRRISLRSTNLSRFGDTSSGCRYGISIVGSRST